ncbi:exonuclease 1 isoform X1 [Antechinus flavipes]|uniref:exonuclease 1 isoform X1 n=1 Tax=Antechinus flavipes TaxID=38775 RepID=UPI0022368755|nr:exonuclease 1 isoform X1 [Antechinus flavipes]
MGIQGLLQFIKDASEPIHIKKYKGQVVAVDTYCWLHKGAFACAEKLAKGEPTDQYVAFCMKFVNMLLSHGIKPILVFDGCTLPSKKEVEKARRERRQTNLLKGKQLLREGKITEARECFARSVNITHRMAHQVIKAARAQGVDCIVAPYEADAQLAYLNKTGIVHAIITEDSDLLAFGCKKVILKMDKLGNGLEIDQARLGMCRQLGDVFTEEKFRYMCVLSGCDYLSSLHGIGLAKACKLLKIANNPDIIKVIKKLGHYLKMNITVPEEYINGFIRANNTFLYQLVFDPVKRKLVPLNDYEDDIDPNTLHYAGQYFDDITAFQIALGNKDINTMEQIDDYNPDTAMPHQSRSQGWNDKAPDQKTWNVNSIWNRNHCLTPKLDAVSDTTPLQERCTTAGTEKVISSKGLNLPKKKLFIKRPRSEELSEDDLLSQYSFSITKKTKKENCEGNKPQKFSEAFIPDAEHAISSKETLNTRPKVRNKFASFLQKKNEECGAVVVPGTRSRFFCKPVDTADFTEKNGSNQSLCETTVLEQTELKLSEDMDNQKPAETNVAQNMNDLNEASDRDSLNSENKFTRTVSPPTLGTLRSCFSWSGNLRDFSRTSSPSPNVVLQQFSRRNEPSVPLTKNTNEIASLSQENSDVLDGNTSPIPEMGGSLQSQESLELSQNSLDSSKLSHLSSKDSDSEESDCSSKPSDNQKSQSSHLHLSLCAKRKDSTLGNKVLGLSKSTSVGSLSTNKIKPLVPAKVSGLSKKLISMQKKNHRNAENKPGVQIKISELWKNFEFKKNSEKLPSCKKPLSPVKDNLQLTPETEEDIYNKPECSHVQRAIFQSI